MIGAPISQKLVTVVLIGTVFGLAGLVFASMPLGRALEDRIGLGWLYALRGEVPPPADVVIVGIDRAAADALGLSRVASSWPRSIHARLIESLTDRGAALIVFDLYFVVSRETGEDGGVAQEDRDLAAAIQQSGRVLLLENMRQQTLDRGSTNILESPVEFLDGARGVGPFPLPDTAVVNHFATFTARNNTPAGEVLPTIPVVALQARFLELLGTLRDTLEQTGFRRLDAVPHGPEDINGADGLRSLMRVFRSEFTNDPLLARRVLDAMETDLALSRSDRQDLASLVNVYSGSDLVYLNFYGTAGTLTTIRYDQVLQDDEVPDLTGKVVFVGDAERSTPEQNDAFNTPFRQADGVDLSGVEIAATAYANLRTGRSLLRRADLHVAALFLAGLLVFAVAYSLPGLHTVAAVLVLAAAYASTAYVLFARQNLLLPLATPIAVQLPLALFAALLLQRVSVERKSELYRKWVPYKAAERPRLLGHVFSVVLFTDLKDSTRLSDQNSEDEYSALITRYGEMVRQSVVPLGGQVEEIAGDGRMCYWDSLREDKDLRWKACLAALELRGRMSQYNREREQDAIVVRMGLHAGPTRATENDGHLGSAPNTVSRIEGLNTYLSTTVLASADIVGGLDGLLVRRLGTFLLKGKDDPISVFEIVGRTDTAGASERDLCGRFSDVLTAFESQQWIEAVVLAHALLADFGDDGPTRLYLDTARRYLNEGPPANDPHVIRFPAA